MLSDETLNEFIDEKLELCEECPTCGKRLQYEVYCYDCFGNKTKKINSIFNKIDDKIEKYIKSMSYLDLNTLVGNVRQVHVNCCSELYNRKRRVKMLGELRYNFDDNVKFTMFSTYKELFEYCKSHTDRLFNNRGFAKKLIIKANPELLEMKSIAATDEYNYEYDKQLFITKTIENIKSLIDVTMKDRMKNVDPKSKLARYMRYTKKTDGTLNQGKLYAYGKIMDVILQYVEMNSDHNIMQIFREFEVKNLITGERMFLDGVVFLKAGKRRYHPLVIELDDKTHDLLVDSKYRLNDLAKNIFCKKNGISMIRVNTSDFNVDLFAKIIKVVSGSKRAKFAALKNFEAERIDHFTKLSGTYDMLEFINK